VGNVELVAQAGELGVEVGEFNALCVTGGVDMTAIRTERPNGGREAAKPPTDVAAFEGEIREFIRRDVTPVRRARSEPQTAETATEHVNMRLCEPLGASAWQSELP